MRQARVATIVGTTIASMMASELIMIVVLPLPTTPWEGRMPGPQPVKASNASKPPQRSARAIGGRPLKRGRHLSDSMTEKSRAPASLEIASETSASDCLLTPRALIVATLFGRCPWT